MKPIIRVQNVSKEYRIGTVQPPYQTLRESLSGAVRIPFRRRSGGSQPRYETIWALKDVNFEIEPGEVVGIVGRNGAGKSTLLKILSRVTEPTTGRIELYGRIGSLLEVGTGFHPELTGRENVFLNGAVLGMRKAEIQRKFDEIVAFSDIEKFIDTPVKFYSSGMIMRLAFSVPAHLEPEIMLLDEVLAVGDLAFQQKCFERMKRMKQSGMTILLVSHNLSAIQGACARAILLEGGNIVASGETSKVIERFRDSMQLLGSPDNPPEEADSHTGVNVTGFDIFGTSGESRRTFQFGESVRIRISLRASRRIESPLINFGLLRADGVNVCNFNNWFDNFKIDYIEGDCYLEGWLPPLRLIPYRYLVSVIVWQRQSGCPQEDLSRLQPLASTTFGQIAIEGPPFTEADGVFQEPARKWVLTRGYERFEHTDIDADSLMKAFGEQTRDAVGVTIQFP